MLEILVMFFIKPKDANVNANILIEVDVLESMKKIVCFQTIFGAVIPLPICVIPLPCHLQEKTLIWRKFKRLPETVLSG